MPFGLKRPARPPLPRSRPPEPRAAPPQRHPAATCNARLQRHRPRFPARRRRNRGMAAPCNHGCLAVPSAVAEHAPLPACAAPTNLPSSTARGLPAAQLACSRHSRGPRFFLSEGHIHRSPTCGWTVRTPSAPKRIQTGMGAGYKHQTLSEAFMTTEA